jgi:hypothetical protein
MLESILNVLDLPGSSVRDVFAGKNPFDQWASPLSGDHRTSGADLVSQYARFNPQSMGTKVVGMGVEMLLDPTNLLGGAGILKRLIGARRLAQTNKAFDATELANLVDTGRYGLVNPEAVARSLERRATTNVVEAMPSPLSPDYPKGLPFYDDKVTLHHASPNLWAPEPGYPHGRARLDFMGEGEGTQVFGHGLYFAENPAVVDNGSGAYMKILAKEEHAPGALDELLNAHETAITELKSLNDRKLQTSLVNDIVSIPDPDNLKRKQLSRLLNQIKVYDQPVKYDIPADLDELMEQVLDLEYMQGAMSDESRQVINKLTQAADRFRAEGIITTPPNRYTLSMPKSARDELLEWEQSIAESDLVQKNLPIDIHEQMGETADGYNQYNSNWDYENTGFMVQKLLPDTIADGGIASRHFTPAQLAENSDDVDKMTSQLLDNYGISGARYLDGFSRKSRTRVPTYNNVIWNQDILNQIKPRIINGVNVPLDDMLPIQRIESWTPRAAIPEREYFENTHVSPLRQVATPGAAMGVYNGARIISHE